MIPLLRFKRVVEREFLDGAAVDRFGAGVQEVGLRQSYAVYFRTTQFPERVRGVEAVGQFDQGGLERGHAVEDFAAAQGAKQVIKSRGVFVEDDDSIDRVVGVDLDRFYLGSWPAGIGVGEFVGRAPGQSEDTKNRQ